MLPRVTRNDPFSNQGYQWATQGYICSSNEVGVSFPDFPKIFVTLSQPGLQLDFSSPGTGRDM